MLLAVFGASGCSSQFGESIDVSSDKYLRIGGGQDVLAKFPDGEPFVIADSQRFASGNADAKSSADPSGRAVGEASVTGVGAAWSEFQIGHVVKNETGTERMVTVRYDVEYEYAIEREDNLLRSPEAFALKAYVSDANKRVLHRYHLLNQDGQYSPDRSKGKESHFFDFTMKPNQSYHLVLAGRLEVKGGEVDSPLSAQLAVSRCVITVSDQ